MTDWHSRFLAMANLVATWSKDPFTKVGAIIVKDKRILATGYNGLPALIQDTPSILNDRPTKNLYVIHAETNAILNAAANGASTRNATIYTNYFPCSNCLKSILNSGISQIVCPPPHITSSETWEKEFQISMEILNLIPGSSVQQGPFYTIDLPVS